MSARVALKDVQEASRRIAPFIHRTPIMTSSTLDKMAGKSLFFKCEIFQKVGAFKVSTKFHIYEVARHGDLRGPNIYPLPLVHPSPTL